VKLGSFSDAARGNTFEVKMVPLLLAQELEQEKIEANFLVTKVTLRSSFFFFFFK